VDGSGSERWTKGAMDERGCGSEREWEDDKMVKSNAAIYYSLHV